MARGKYLSLEEARKMRNGLERFAKEHPSKADRKGFEKLLDAMTCGERPASSEASDVGSSANCDDIQTRRDISKNASD